jgi:hypothetical protein
MMGFMEWIEFNKKKEKKNVGSISQSNQQNGSTDIERTVNRDNKTIYTTVVHNKSESEY